jgi:hypothetical protein
VSDSGNAIFYDLGDGVRLRWNGSAWSAAESLPSGLTGAGSFFYSGCSIARTGDLLCMQITGFGNCLEGLWMTYDAARNTVVQPRLSTSPGPGYLLGLSGCNKGLGLSVPALSVSGIAAVTLQNRYDTLPSPSLQNGDGRAITNLWGAYFR